MQPATSTSAVSSSSLAKTWGIYGLPRCLELAAFVQGLEARGVPYLWRNHNAWKDDCGEDFSVVVLSGTREKGGDIVSYYRPRGVPVIVMDYGYLDRVSGIATFETGHWQVGLGGLQWVPPFRCPPDRFKKLSTKVQYREEPSSRAPIIVCGQHIGDPSHGHDHNALVKVYSDIADQIRRQTKRKLWFRPHPDSPGVKPKGYDGIDRGPLSETLSKAHSIVTLNSNIGLDAILVGCPVIHCMNAPYAEIATRWPVKIETVRRPSKRSVLQYLHRVAYAQWTLDEVRSGQTYDFLKGTLHDKENLDPLHA